MDASRRRLSKHQVTLPVAVLQAAGLAAGDEVQVRVTGSGWLEIVKRDPDAFVARYAGTFDSNTFPPGYLDEQRAEWSE